jgi:hypothetical protein
MREGEPVVKAAASDNCMTGSVSTQVSSREEQEDLLRRIAAAA